MLVTSYPAMLANFRPAEVLHDLVGQLLVEGKAPERRDMVDELLHMIACKAAIKAGDRLSAGRGGGAGRTAAFGPGQPPLPSRPADGAGFYPGRAGPAVFADVSW